MHIPLLVYSYISFDKCTESCGHNYNHNTELFHHPHAALGHHSFPTRLSGNHWYVLHPYGLNNHIFNK